MIGYGSMLMKDLLECLRWSLATSLMPGDYFLDQRRPARTNTCVRRDQQRWKVRSPRAEDLEELNRSETGASARRLPARVMLQSAPRVFCS